MPFGFGGVVLVTLPNKYAGNWLVRLIDNARRPIRRGKSRHWKEGYQ
jgi:hypothetical protein